MRPCPVFCCAGAAPAVQPCASPGRIHGNDVPCAPARGSSEPAWSDGDATAKQKPCGSVAVHHYLTTTAGGSVVSDGLKAHGRDAGDASADKHDGCFSRHRSPRRPIGRRGLWERSRDAVCRRASVSARSCDMRAMRAYHTTVPSVLHQQHARGQTRYSGTQTSKHDGATFAAVFR